MPICAPNHFMKRWASASAGEMRVVVSGSEVKQDAADLILARELVTGTDTLSFRDGKR